MTFRVGQKVVCVDDNPRIGVWLPGEALKLGAIYTIAAIGESFGEPAVQLVEIARISDHPLSLRGIWGYHQNRFRPIVERKTDISFAHEILRKASKPARAPAFSSPQRA